MALEFDSKPDPDWLCHERPTPSPLISNFQAPIVVGAGLSNLGNTCFMNAVLQCLTHLVPLLEKLIKSDHCSPCLVVEEGEGFCAMCALRGHVDLSLRNCGWFFSPFTFANNLSKISSHFKLGLQEDAHELLRCLLDRLHVSCVGPISKAQPSVEQNSLVDQVFGGRLRSQLRCSKCGHFSDSYEALLDISVGIDDVDTLTDALCSFTNVEKVEEATCEGCKTQGAMEKQLKLDQAPAVIALHLKRFENIGGSLDKIDKFIKYPLELDVQPYLSSPDDTNQTKYDLYAILVHVGSVSFGHYFSFVRSLSFVWHLLDDSQVSRVSEETALDQNAYILFYVKQGVSPWFSDFIRSQEIPNYKDLYMNVSPISVLDRTDRGLVSYSGGSSSSLSEPPEKDENPSAFEAASSETCEENHVSGPYQAGDGNRNTTGQLTPDKIKVISQETPHPHTPEKITTELKETPKQHSGSALTMDNVTKRRFEQHTPIRIMDVFEDESFEDEKDDHLILPKAKVGQKRSREPLKPTPQKLNDPRLTQLGKIMSSMPNSRRAGLLACISQEPGQKTPQSRRRW